MAIIYLYSEYIFIKVTKIISTKYYIYFQTLVHQQTECRASQLFNFFWFQWYLFLYMLSIIEISSYNVFTHIYYTTLQ